MDPLATDQKPLPEVKKKWFVNRHPMFSKRTGPGANKQETMNTQATDQKPLPQVKKIACGSANVLLMCYVSVPDANEEGADNTSNPESEVDVEYHFNRGPRCPVAQMSPGTSGNIQIATPTTGYTTRRREAVLNMIRMRNHFFRPRIALYLINIVLHVTNVLEIHQAAKLTGPSTQVAQFLNMSPRYLSTWVVILHIYHSVSALAMDVYLKATESRDTDRVEINERMLNYLTEILLKEIIWPLTIVVTGFFWSVFLYDRELIFPQFVDEVVSCVSNHILHTWIMIFIVLEVLVHPRLRPLPSTWAHATAWMAKIIFLALYVFVFYYTRITEGIWLYPIFLVAYNGGVIQFFLLHAVILLLYLYATRLFWCCNDRIHKKKLWFKERVHNRNYSQSQPQRTKCHIQFYRREIESKF